MNKDEGTPMTPSSWRWVSLRIFGILAALLLIGLGFFALHSMFEVQGGIVTISIALIFALPYSLGAIAALLSNPNGRKHYDPNIVASATVMVVLVLGGILLREGVICMVMLSPAWFGAAILGAMTVTNLQTRFRSSTRMNSSLFIVLPFLVLAGEALIPPQTDSFTVTRSIVIDAPPSEIWPHLLKLENIDPREGRWNLTQDILAVPLPRSAIVIGEGVAARRMAQWGDDITFEEHIFLWQEDESLRWNFVFPNASVHQYTDRHISPDGRHLKIQQGGYSLVALSDGRTRLTLDTQYDVTTPVNLYSAAWGELILGDIQTNILNLIKARAETSGSVMALRAL